ncbi:MAG: cold-shock protein [Anaerolineae bacterium]
MNFRDQWTTDENGNKFVFTVEMQRRLREQGLSVEPASLKELEIARPEAKVRHAEPLRRSTPATTESKPVINFDTPATIQIDPQTGKYIGRMKWYNAKKGYGFIVRGGGEEIFFHRTGAVGDPLELKEGQWILYDVEDTVKGPEATDIEPFEGDIEMFE